MRKLFQSFFAVSLLVMAGCATTPRHEFNEQADFANLKTFAWLEPEYAERNVSVSHPVLDSPLLGQRVHRATTTILEERGYREVAENPDFLVTYHTAEGEQERRSGTYMQLGYGRRHSPFFGTGVLLDLTPRTFQEGTLIIDIVDAKTDELVWRGWNDAVLTQRNFADERIAESVRFILSAFPPESR